MVLDCLCGEECNKGYALLKPMGKYILYGSSNVVTGEMKSFFSAARSVRDSIGTAVLLFRAPPLDLMKYQLFLNTSINPPQMLSKNTVYFS